MTRTQEEPQDLQQERLPTGDRVQAIDAALVDASPTATRVAASTVHEWEVISPNRTPCWMEFEGRTYRAAREDA